MLAVAHALETHKTVTGDDVVAVIEGRPGQLIDGTMYADPTFLERAEAYHMSVVDAHIHHGQVEVPLPEPLVPAGVVGGDGVVGSDGAGSSSVIPS